MDLEQIFSFENLLEAHKMCRLSKQHKRGTIMFEIELGNNIDKLARELTTKKYKLGKYRAFKIYDPKLRLIEALPYKDRVVLMCFCKNAMEPWLEKRLIFDNAASRKDKGTDFAINRLHGFMNKLYINNQNNETYFLKCDIAKYFQSINHEVLLAKLKKCGFSGDEIWFMDLVIRSHGNIGVPLGNQTSQWFALLYLDEIDRLVKEVLRAPYYVRYMDDFILLSEDKEFLQRCKAEIGRICAERLKLRLNEKTQIGKLKNGVDFLGFNHKLTATGKIIKSMRASSLRRQRHYLKAILRYYMDDIVDDEYLNTRLAAFKTHLKGTTDLRFLNNKINSLRADKNRLRDSKK